MRLLVIARVEVAAELLRSSARDLHGRIDQLRQDLLQTPAIAEVSIAVDTRPVPGER